MAASNGNNNYEVHSSGLFELPVLYHDAHIIIVNKPPGMLSVPGKEILTKLEVRPRSEQWHNVIRDVIELLQNLNCCGSPTFTILCGLTSMSAFVE
jgi:hypothetical protein